MGRSTEHKTSRRRRRRRFRGCSLSHSRIRACVMPDKNVKFDGGIDYEEAFDHVARLETIRMIIAIAAQYRWKIHQMDVKSAFLNGLLEEDVYVEQPEGYVAKGLRRYANEILKMFGMDKCNPIGTPIENKIKPSQHDRGKKPFHGRAYNKTFEDCEEDSLLHLSDWDGSKDHGRSTSEFLFFLGNNAFTWSSKKQPIVTLSSCEAYYLVATSCVCHAIWLRSMLKELHMEQEDATEIYVDNKSAIDLAKNPAYHDRSKNINTRYHYIREWIARKDVRVLHTSSEDQVADIFTKSLDERDFTRRRMMLGVGKSSLKGGVGS
ncbi:retrovirus-related pol polyprotein from transposon TNT 1-94 [Tanacetum coccineum]